MKKIISSFIAVLILFVVGINQKVSSQCTADSWAATNTTNAPSARIYHTVIWTGTEMIVWGGYDNSNNLNTGGKYNPVTDTWTATNLTNAPSARFVHRAVWTGTEMIVWGGSDGSYLITGGRYNPTTDTWTATTTTNAPDGRDKFTSVWTGIEMIVWGGQGYSGGLIRYNTGARYNPVTDTWTTTTSTNAPIARESHTAVWTGNEMIVWGGANSFVLNTGARYNPATDIWTATNRQRKLIEKNICNGLALCSISIWEVAKLVEKKRLLLTIPINEWIEKASEYPGIEVIALTKDIIIKSTQLPGNFHSDPADQLIVATSIILQIPILTADKKIINYPFVDLCK